MTAIDQVDPKKPLFDQFSEVAKAFAHGHRLALLEVLAQDERDVNTLSRTTGLSVANASQHLKVLRSAGLVTCRRAGKHTLYALADDTVVDLVRSLRAFAERHNDAARQTVLTHWPGLRDHMEVSRETLSGWIADDTVALLDTRPLEEFRASHIHGSLHVPKGAADTVLPLLAGKPHIVAYCRGAYCASLHETLDYLHQKGRPAARLEDGFAEWRAAGYPVVRPGEGSGDAGAGP